MINRFKSLFASLSSADTHPANIEVDAAHLAAAVLLVHAAQLDGHVDETETAVLARITGPNFGLSDDESQNLLDLAAAEAEDANDLFKWTKQINEHFEPDHKIQLIELLWRVVLADDIVTDYEANLLRRVAGLIHVSDKDSAMARQNAQAD